MNMKRYTKPQTEVKLMYELSAVLTGLSNADVIKDEKDGYEDLSKDWSVWENEE